MKRYMKRYDITLVRTVTETVALNLEATDVVDARYRGWAAGKNDQLWPDAKMVFNVEVTEVKET